MIEQQLTEQDWGALARYTTDAPMDLDRVRSTINRAYTDAQRTPPGLFLTADSPMAGCYMAALGTPVVDGFQQGMNRDALRTKLVAEATSVTHREMAEAVIDRLIAQVWAQPDAAKAVPITTRTDWRTEVRNQGWQCGYGTMDAGWLKSYDTDDTKRANVQGLMDLAKAGCGWWWPFEGCVIVSPPPVILNLDAEQRLHCEDGEAIRYPDGWGFYAWGNIRVPSWVITTPPEALTKEQMSYPDNITIRRIIWNRAGWDTVVKTLEMTPEQADDYGTLYRFTLDNERVMKIVKVVDGTPIPTQQYVGGHTVLVTPSGHREPMLENFALHSIPEGWAVEREGGEWVAIDPDLRGCEQGRDGSWYKVYWVRVPGTMTTAREAVAWSYHLKKAEDYKPVLRR